MPKTLLCVFDNCVGQNKSQLIMMFLAMLLVILYRKVVLIYLILGHSHNQADQVVTWCRNAMRSRNFYTPMDIVNIVTEIKSIAATCIDHCDSWWPFYTGWDTILPKYFKKMPSWYIFNYFFEFDEGHLSMRHLRDTDVPHIQLIMKEDFEIIRTLILRDLFGSKVDTTVLPL